MSEQLTHSSNATLTEKFPVVLVTDHVKSPANLGSLLRLADAFHIEKIIFCGIEEEIIQSNRLKRTSRSTEKKVDFYFEENIEKTLQQLQQQQYQLIALEITNDSIAVDQLQLKKNQKIALILGDENFGVSPKVLQLTEQNIHIQMFGENSSMNVAQATGITLYEITKKLRAFQKK
jgi:tRNA G18 (ribose-2'-O)-methylase SpoU